MQEGFLHYIWSLQYFTRSELRTTEGETVEVFDPGMLNTHAGPDFSNARVKIGGMQWIGHVEVHLHASEWMTHGHSDDQAYDTVILHVVWKEDKPVTRRDGTRLPAIELRGRVDERLIRDYRQLIGSAFSIPCQQRLPAIEPVVKSAMMGRALAVRLEKKAQEVLKLLQFQEGDWEETSYQLLAGAFGFNINREPFLQLARTLPLKILRKQDLAIQREALLFGQAGFLEPPKGDSYYLALRKEYQLLSHKYGLEASRLSVSQWRFLRLRPPNFPSLRIAQFCAVVGQHRSLFSRLTELRSREELSRFFNAQPSPYWKTHYRFSVPSVKPAHDLGQGSVEIMITNTVAPLLAAYSQYSDQAEYMERAIRILDDIPAEENNITRRWTDLGMPPQNAGEAQGQIELFNTFCRGKRCLECGIGAALLRPVKNEPGTPAA
ncbi:MAG: DUF2851 family protein [Cyclobacteriaceae bacterium]|nr:DUF2851 family protein [Cyclobacteriaceae bacterium]